MAERQDVALLRRDVPRGVVQKSKTELAVAVEQGATQRERGVAGLGCHVGAELISSRRGNNRQFHSSDDVEPRHDDAGRPFFFDRQVELGDSLSVEMEQIGAAYFEFGRSAVDGSDRRVS